MRVLVAVMLVVIIAGCTGVDAPCPPWDGDCVTAALFAEESLGANDWDAVAATGLDCDDAPAMRGFVDPDRCWLVQLDGLVGGPVTSEAVVVRTTEGDLVVVQETITQR